jgi:beta-mannosidase
LKVSTDKLVKDLYLNFPNQSIFLEDNYFDLLPNQVKIIDLSGEEKIDLRAIEIKHIQQSK